MLIQENKTLGTKKQYVIGKIAHGEVRTPSGIPLLVSGQLITSAHASVAEKLGILNQLYDIADNWPLDQKPEVQRGKSSETVSVVLGSQNTQSDSQSVENVWEQVTQRAAHVCNCSPEAWEEHQIKGALGYPVVRTIFDNQGHPILETGDLVTYSAVNKAKQSDVLDALLNAVHWG